MEKRIATSSVGPGDNLSDVSAFWLPRFYTAVHALGLRIPVVIGLFAGIGQQLILVAAAAVVYGSPVGSGFDSRSKAPVLIHWTLG